MFAVSLGKRVLDLNDRALRNIICGLGGKAHGVPRETGFDITVASEMMAILCLTSDLEDMKKTPRQHHHWLYTFWPYCSC